jgi:radical SAM superfamily enzyme YgiQ (UPF0313 family)
MYDLKKLKENRPKKVLLVTPTSYSEVGLTKWLSPNLGIERLAGYVKKFGHIAETFDTNLYHTTKNGPSLQEKLKSYKWDVIGFSVYDDSIVYDIVNMNMASRECPDALIIAGGTGAQFDYQAILDKSPARIVVLGEGEKPLLNLLDGTPVEDIPGIVFKNYNVSLNEKEFQEVTNSIDYARLPYETYWDYYVNQYKKDGKEITKEVSQQIHTIRIYTRNYCPMGCKFCSSTNFIRSASDKRSIPLADISGEELICLLEKIIKAHPRVETIYFTDDDFTTKRSNLIDFLKLLIKKQFPVTFLSFARIDNLDEEIISLMKMAGFRTLNIGMENFQPEILKEFNKDIKLEVVNKNLSTLKKYGIRPVLSFILCSPKAKLEYVENTAKKILEELKKETFYAGIATVAKPLKGSSLYEDYGDFEIQLTSIPGSRMFYKTYCFNKFEDPEVAEFVYRLLFQWANYINEKVKGKEGHFYAQVQSEEKIEVILKVINEIKSERGKPEQFRFSKMSYEEKEKSWDILRKYSFGASDL